MDIIILIIIIVVVVVTTTTTIIVQCHYSCPISSTNVIVYIWQTTHYSSLVLPPVRTHSCRLAPVIYKTLKVKICASDSTIGDLYTQNQYHYISETKQ
jgi:hypothetical protein